MSMAETAADSIGRLMEFFEPRSESRVCSKTEDLVRYAVSKMRFIVFTEVKGPITSSIQRTATETRGG